MSRLLVQHSQRLQALELQAPKCEQQRNMVSRPAIVSMISCAHDVMKKLLVGFIMGTDIWKVSERMFTRSRVIHFLMLAQHFTRLPGLSLRPAFVSTAESEELWKKAFALLGKVQLTSGLTKTSKSPLHNLKEDKSFSAVRIEADDGGFLNCEHFSTYGARGASLTYFRGRQNLPLFIHEFIDTRLNDLAETQAVAKAASKPIKDLTWRWTLNHYSVVTNRDPVLFAFHKDIAVNGQISAILTLGSSAAFEMATDEPEPQLVESVTLEPKSLVVIANESRWDFVHRVVALPNTAERISFVFGCQ